MDCTHDKLQVTVSPHAQEAGFKRQPAKKLIAAAVRNGRVPKLLGLTEDVAGTDETSPPPADFPFCFPAPLVLPGDDLALDPKQDPQSLLSWIQEEERNAVTSERKTVYVARAPIITEEVAFMRQWTAPVSKKGAGGSLSTLEPPTVDHVREYLEAFYYGLPVKTYPDTFKFKRWYDKVPRKSRPTPVVPDIGLAIGDSCTEIRIRPCPTRTFAWQFCLEDILDGLMENIPEDAYAVLLLVDHDLYEDDDDDFCCGRAYGGSRIAVVSSARYRPDLDEAAGIDREHMWPSSHCAKNVKKVCSEDDDVIMISDDEDSDNDTGETRDRDPLAAMNRTSCPNPEETPLGVAIVEARKASRPPHKVGLAEYHPWLSPCQPADMYGLWLSRVARTASHELGHCFALDHCIYYACVMQSTSGMAEDVRQPPYLCHICLKKVTRAMLDVHPELEEIQYVTQRDMVLSHYCKKWERVPIFAGYRASATLGRFY
jgi:archaemetzincin